MLKLQNKKREARVLRKLGPSKATNKTEKEKKQPRVYEINAGGLLFFLGCCWFGLIFSLFFLLFFRVSGPSGGPLFSPLLCFSCSPVFFFVFVLFAFSGLGLVRGVLRIIDWHVLFHGLLHVAPPKCKTVPRPNWHPTPQTDVRPMASIPKGHASKHELASLKPHSPNDLFQSSNPGLPTNSYKHKQCNWNAQLPERMRQLRASPNEATRITLKAPRPPFASVPRKKKQ